MIPKSCHHLAEVDFPIAEVSRHAMREKHLSCPRCPSASCRAVLMALLLPDPCDEHCPAAFNDAARHILLTTHGHPGGCLGFGKNAPAFDVVKSRTAR